MSRFHDHSKIFDFRDIELAFLKLQVKVELGHMLEDMTGPLFIGFWVGGGDKEIVHIDNEPAFSNHVSEQVIHEPLEYNGRVTKAEEHDCGFKESFVCDKDHFPLMAVFDTDVVVSSTNIKLDKVVSIFQLVHKVRNEREEVDIMSGVFIEVPVVLTRAKFAVFLLDKEEGGCLEGVEGTNLSSCQVFVKEILGSFLLVGGEWVDFAYLRHKSIVEVDFMIIWLRRGNVVGCFFREDLGKVSIF